MLSKNTPISRRHVAEEAIQEAKRLYKLAEDLDHISSQIEDKARRHEIKNIVLKVLESSRKLSSLSSDIAS